MKIEYTSDSDNPIVLDIIEPAPVLEQKLQEKLKREYKWIKWNPIHEVLKIIVIHVNWLRRIKKIIKLITRLDQFNIHQIML